MVQLSKGWPFIIHIEFASLTGKSHREYMEDLEGFLRKHPKFPFVMIHMAQLEAGPVRRLLDAHPNLHFMTSHASPFYQGGGKPFINMFERGRLKPEWRKLISEHPDRFVFALDNVFARFWTPSLYLGKMDMWWPSTGRPPGRRRPCPGAQQRRAALETSAQAKRRGGYPALALREGTGPVSGGTIF